MREDASYTRFMVLGDARTGSNMLVDALNSHPEIVCFREVLNWGQDFVDYAVAGYDERDPTGVVLRNEEPLRFLNERIFARQPADIKAVGFKFHYSHVFGVDGLLEGLIADRQLAIVHLERRNALRTLVSRRMAESTGRWFEAGEQETLGTAVDATKTALPTANKLRLTPEECRVQFYTTESNVQLFNRLFAEHRVFHLTYEDVTSSSGGAADELLRFLGATLQPLKVRLRRQNPQPLAELIENYDELRDAFAGGQYEEFFLS